MATAVKTKPKANKKPAAQRTEVVGVAEIADILGVSRQRVSNLRRQHASFPAPYVELRCGPIWRTDEVEEFIENWARQTGRPKQS